MRMADGDAAFARCSDLRGTGWHGTGAQVRLRPCGQTWLVVMLWPDRSADEGTRVGSPMPPFGAPGVANMRRRQQSASQGLVNPCAKAPRRIAMPCSFVAPPVPEFGWQSLPVAAIAAKPASLGEVSRQRRGCSAAAKLHEVAEKLSHRPRASARGGSGTSREVSATVLQGCAFQTHVLAVLTSRPQIVHVSNSFVCACVPGLTHVRLQRAWYHPSSQGRPIAACAQLSPVVFC
jgi:hypothetical protein